MIVNDSHKTTYYLLLESSRSDFETESASIRWTHILIAKILWSSDWSKCTLFRLRLTCTKSLSLIHFMWTIRRALQKTTWRIELFVSDCEHDFLEPVEMHPARVFLLDFFFSSSLSNYDGSLSSLLPSSLLSFSISSKFVIYFVRFLFTTTSSTSTDPSFSINFTCLQILSPRPPIIIFLFKHLPHSVFSLLLRLNLRRRLSFVTMTYVDTNSHLYLKNKAERNVQTLFHK